MTKDLLKNLLSRYINGECSDEEKEMLSQIIKNMDNIELQESLNEAWIEYQPNEFLSEEKSKQILSTVLHTRPITHRKPKRTHKKILVVITSIAATFALLFGSGYYLLQSSREETIILKTESVAMNESVPYVRNIILPDSSKIVLQANSTIELLPSFNHEKREIRLNGEAFFDIKHDIKKPFIIYSGELKTTVLGTAFNITAWPGDDQIRVTVTRGKVRVEDTDHILANLSLNEEIEYNKSNLTGSKYKEKEVAATEKVTEWTRQDMEFNEMSFKDISAVISKRYNVDIEIRGNKLASTLVVASFSGTESLESVLKTICSINDATTYSIESNKVTIFQTK